MVANDVAADKTSKDCGYFLPKYFLHLLIHSMNKTDLIEIKLVQQIRN